MRQPSMYDGLKQMKATCAEPRCGQEWEYTEKGKVKRDAHVSSQHTKGRGSCNLCGMQWRGTYKHKGMCTDDDEYCAGSTRKSKESTRFVIPKDLPTFPRKWIQEQL